MPSKKISSDQLSGNTEVFSDLLKPAVSKKVAVQAAEEEKPEDNPVHLTMLVKESTRKSWKQFFIEHGLNTTQGIEIAMLHLLDDVNSGKYKLSKGGLSEVSKNED